MGKELKKNKKEFKISKTHVAIVLGGVALIIVTALLAKGVIKFGDIKKATETVKETLQTEVTKVL